jgi:hypothetical protein
MVNLTANAVSMLYNKQTPDGFEPWLQVIDTKKIKPASGAGGDRYRVVLSDGAYYISGMLATQMAPVCWRWISWFPHDCVCLTTILAAAVDGEREHQGQLRRAAQGLPGQRSPRPPVR